MSFAGWNEGDFKPSPLFKHALAEAIARLEGKAEASGSGGDGEAMDTSKPGCVNPNAPETAVPLCETSEETCEGDPTCYLGTCSGPTCPSITCMGTCYETCYGETCSTCEGICPWVKGGVWRIEDGKENRNWWGWKDREVQLWYIDVYPPQKCNETTFDGNGNYSMESDYALFWIIATATRKADGYHGKGARTFAQGSQTAIIDIQMDEFWY